MNILERQILSDIDNIETVTLEAEYNVLSTLIDCYNKQSMIMEYYKGDDITEFSIFQEGYFMEDGENKLAKENIFKRLWRWFQAAILKIQYNMMNNRPKRYIKYLNKFPDDTVIHVSKKLAVEDSAAKLETAMTTVNNSIKLFGILLDNGTTDVNEYKEITENIENDEIKSLRGMSMRKKTEGHDESMTVGQVKDELRKIEDTIGENEKVITNFIKQLKKTKMEDEEANTLIGSNKELLSVIKDVMYKISKMYTVTVDQMTKQMKAYVSLFDSDYVSADEEKNNIKNKNKEKGKVENVDDVSES